MTQSVVPKPVSRKPRNTGVAVASRPYHHGSLPTALLEAAEQVLRRDGLPGLTLRAIAREAGVSHTAPKHHFGDTAAILSELAAIGHLRLAAEMAERARGVEPAKVRRKATAMGYVDFGRKNPDLFRLMSRKELLDFKKPSLAAALQVSSSALAGVFGPKPASGEPRDGDAFSALSAPHAVAMTAAWAYVHGLTTLLVDNRLERIAQATGTFSDTYALVEAAIANMQLLPESSASASA